MNHFKHIILFIIVFTAAFLLINESGFISRGVLFEDLGGIPWLYSTIGIIFSMLSAFIIQKEWDHWNNITESVKNEVDSLLELWLWAKHFPEDIKGKFHHFIRRYAEIIIEVGLRGTEHGKRSERIEEILHLLYDDMFEILQQKPELMPTAFAIFTDIIKYRTKRLYNSTLHMPQILKYSFMFSAYLLITLSLFIGVKNIWLDYMFTLSIATLVYTLYVVVEDLDNPLRPGIWHVTTKDYEDLLERIDKNIEHHNSHS